MVTVYNGKPNNLEGREQKEILSYELLDELNIDYISADHESAMTMEACQEIDKALDTHICKNLFLCNRQETQFYLLLIPDGKKFKTKELSSQLGVARLSFANAEHMQKHLNITPGSVSIMGLKYDSEDCVRLLIDEDILKQKTVGIHPCVNTSCVKISVEDLINKLVPALKHPYTKVTLIGEE